MARQFVGLEPEPLYRAVILYKYSGMHDLPLLAYLDTNGEAHEYHAAYVYGPYEKPGPAQTMVKREGKYAKQGYRNHYDYDLPYGPARSASVCKVAEVIGLVEETTPKWIAFSKPNIPG